MSPLDELREKATARKALPSPRTRRLLRQSAGISLQDVADACGVTRATVSRWERGLRNPTGEGLRRYLEALAELRELA